MTSHRKVREEAVEHLAARLSNTGQVLDAWAQAMGSADELLERRLRRAVRELHGVVASLTANDEEFRALESGAPCTDAVDHRADPANNALVKSLADEGLGMRGRSEMISFIEFVAFLSSLNKDGVLQVQTPEEQYIIELRGGCVVYATVEPEASGCRLSEILMGQKAISADDLATGKAKARGDELLGEALLRQGLVSEEALHAALRQHALWVFCAAHQVGSGFEFQFEENTQYLIEPDIRLGISHLLLESARLLDESVESDWVEVQESDGDDLDHYRLRLDESIHGEEVSVPVLPDATGQLLALCWSDDFDVEQLLECVHHDQALCAHLLRIANSAAYAPVTPISSIQLAITRLGLDKLREVAMALTLKQELFQIPGWENTMRALWRTAAVTGGFGSAIGKTCGTGAARGSMGGLLLDLGKPIVLNSLYEIERVAQVELTPHIAEVLLEEYHTEVGELLAEQWSLPDWLAGVMRYHHDYEACEAHRTEAMMGHLAGEFAMWAQGPKEQELERLVSLPACGELGLERSKVVSILKQSQRILAMAKLYS